MFSAPDWWYYVTVFGIGMGAVIEVHRNHIAYKQEKTTKQGMLDERFNMGVVLLDRENLAVRVGGINVLTDMAKLYPEHNHVRVMEIFVSFLSYPPVKQGGPYSGKIDVESADISAISRYVNGRGELLRNYEKEASFSLKNRFNNTDFEVRGGKLVPWTLKSMLGSLRPNVQAQPAVPRPPHG